MQEYEFECGWMVPGALHSVTAFVSNEPLAECIQMLLEGALEKSLPLDTILGVKQGNVTVWSERLDDVAGMLGASV